MSNGRQAKREKLDAKHDTNFEGDILEGGVIDANQLEADVVIAVP